MSKGNSFYPLSASHYPLFFVFAVIFGLTACAPKGEALYNRAEKSLDTGDARAAVIDLKNLVKDEPQNGKARALLAEALAQAGDINAAAIEIQKAKDLGATKEQLLVPECTVMGVRGEADKVLAGCNPDQVQGDAKVPLQIATGRALMSLDRAEEAKAQFQAAQAAKPDNLDALLGLAGAAYETGGLPAAKAVLEKAPEAVRSNPSYWMTVGSVNAQGGDLLAAEKAFQTAIEKSGKGAESGQRLMALGALAEVQMRQGKIKEATATAELLSKAAPNNPIVKQLRGQIAAAAGNYDEARNLLEEAVAAMPDNTEARLLLGMVNMQQGNLGQAEMHFENVVTKQPDNVRAQRLLAEARAKSQSPAETLEAMKPALSQASPSPSLLTMAGRLSLASGNRPQALSYFAQAAAQPADQQTPEVQLEIAGGFLAAGDADRAIEILQVMPQGGATGYQREYLLLAALLQKGDKVKATEEAKALVERSGDDPQVRNLVAAVFSAAGQPDAGRAQFAEALKLKPNDPQTLINLGRLDLAEGKTADAERTFRKVLETDPKNMIATMGAAAAAGAQGNAKEAEKLLQKAAADHPDSVEAQLALAQFYLGSQDFGKAQSVLDEAAKKSPDNAEISNARGLALMGQKDVAGAIASFRKATEQAPKAYGYTLNLARAYISSNDLKGALDVLNGLLKAEPTFLPALALAGAATLQAGDLEQAAGYVARLRQAAPDAPGTFALEGDLAMAQKRYRDALEAYRKASAKGTNRDLVYAQYRAAVQAGAANPAKPLEEWVAARPNDVDAVANLAQLRQQAGDLEGAATLYEQALTKAPDNAVLLNNLAVVYQEQGNPKALETAERAYNAAPNAAAVQDTYGWLLLENGKTDRALEILAEAAKGLPDIAEVQYHYAAALAKSGKTAEAVPLLKKAAAGQIPPKAKADAEKLLQQISQ
jgi:putative PEP-CTERM system TPR-repeat lipoprotein